MAKLLATIIEQFQKELDSVYPLSEIKSIIRLVFNEVLGFSAADTALKKNDPVSAEKEQVLINILSRLSKHEPVQYVLGTTEFYGLRLTITKDVLIPRPETEELARWIISDWKGREGVNILDIGTGSGCIALALKRNLPSSVMYATDISEAALKVAKRNADQSGCNITFLRHDILGGLPLLPGIKFDVIISNPPYIPISESSNLSKNVVDHEPHTALFVPDSNPLLFYDKITAFSIKQLSLGGKLYFEIQEDRGKELLLFLQQYFNSVVIRKDINEKERMIAASNPQQ